MYATIAGRLGSRLGLTRTERELRTGRTKDIKIKNDSIIGIKKH
jgi:hypothetical protein